MPLAVTTLTVLVAGMGAFALRWRPRTASAPSAVPRAAQALWTGSAISSEFISVAVFLGTAGLVLAHGIDMLWLPLGAAAGHVVLQAFVTAPLRRSGTITLSDFAQWRFGSGAVRRAVSACVCFIGWFCLLPQLQSAGVALRAAAGAPVWMGWAVVVVVTSAIVITGGMRGVTIGRAFRFWLRFVVLAVPVVALIAAWQFGDCHDPARAAAPAFVHETTVTTELDVAVRVTTGTRTKVSGVIDGRRRDGDRVVLAPGTHTLGEGTRLVFPARAAVPTPARLPSQGAEAWATPFGRGYGHPLFTTYSMLICLLLGTMGLPQVVGCLSVRSGGRAARRTAAMVPALLGLFCIFPTLYGALGRIYAPGLLMTGEGEAAVLMLPHRLAPGLFGSFVTCLIATGAFAAFATASCCVVMAIAGTISHCALRGGNGSFLVAALIAVAVPLGLVAWIGPLGSAGLVTLPCAVSACSLCPLLVLGVWWRRLTPVGATAGLVVGCALAVTAALTHIFGGPRSGWSGALLAQSTLVIVPVTFAVMILVSLLTPLRVPAGVDRAMARLHLPEDLSPEPR